MILVVICLRVGTAKLVSASQPRHGEAARGDLSSTLPSFSLPNLILYLGIPCALVKLME